MPCGQVTIGAGTNTKLQAATQRAMQLVIQNNSSSYIRVGDDVRVSYTSFNVGFGQQIGPGGYWNSGAFTSGATNLNIWYVAGASGLVIDYQFNPEG